MAALLGGLAVALLVGSPPALAAPPPNDDFANAQVLPSDSFSVTENNAEATRETGEPNHGKKSVWYRWTAPSSSTTQISACKSNFDTILSVYTGPSVDNLTQVARNNDSFACSNFTRSKVSFHANGGTTYKIAVASDFGSGDLTLELRRPSNDDFSNAKALRGFKDSVRGTNVNGTRQPGEPRHAGERGGSSVWYRWTAPGNGIAVIDTCASALNSLLGVYTGGTLGGLNRVASNDNGCGRQSRVSFFAKRGTKYRIAVDGRAGDTGRVRVDVAEVKHGGYKGKTEFIDHKPIDFKISASGRRIKSFTFNQDLDCSVEGTFIGTLKIKDATLKRAIRVRRTATGGKFSKRVRARFKGGGHLTVRVRGKLIPPEKAKGHLKVTAGFPGGVTCKNFFGAVSWKAHHR